MNLVIKIRGIVRNFPLGNEVVKVLKGIDLDIERGEYVALMGPSGSGKSTLMNLLGCLDTPTAGTYELNGKDNIAKRKSILDEFTKRSME